MQSGRNMGIWETVFPSPLPSFQHQKLLPSKYDLYATLSRCSVCGSALRECSSATAHLPSCRSPPQPLEQIQNKSEVFGR